MHRLPSLDGYQTRRLHKYQSKACRPGCFLASIGSPAPHSLPWYKAHSSSSNVIRRIQAVGSVSDCKGQHGPQPSMAAILSQDAARCIAMLNSTEQDNSRAASCHDACH
eukprot:scaffold263392_cov30-Tisochrysis_lutea.AAC.2